MWIAVWQMITINIFLRFNLTCSIAFALCKCTLAGWGKYRKVRADEIGCFGQCCTWSDTLSGLSCASLLLLSNRWLRSRIIADFFLTPERMRIHEESHSSEDKVHCADGNKIPSLDDGSLLLSSCSVTLYHCHQQFYATSFTIQPCIIGVWNEFSLSIWFNLQLFFTFFNFYLDAMWCSSAGFTLTAKIATPLLATLLLLGLGCVVVFIIHLSHFFFQFGVAPPSYLILASATETMHKEVSPADGEDQIYLQNRDKVSSMEGNTVWIFRGK